MALFQVPGWSVPSAPVPVHATSKKRKRRASQSPDDLQSAQANLEKLVKILGDNSSKGDSRRSKKKSSGKAESQQNDVDGGRSQARKGDPPTPKAPSSKDTSGASKKRNKKQKASKNSSSATASGLSGSTPKASGFAHGNSGLTSMQKNMKESLDGARFRLINEKLYKSDSSEAVKMMKKDPKVFQDYHTGFRHQVQSWPSNPVSHYIDELSKYPPKSVVADLGCGDAALAKALHPKSIHVLSFDLLSDGVFITEADICSHLPLPGSEPLSEETTQGEGQIVDVVVCALSLMGINWPRCIREAWRILRPSGELKIAEVSSRFGSVDEFVSLVCDVGFKLKRKDDHNTHFTLFQFRKIARVTRSEQEWAALMSRGGVLKPCEYKRR
ncbi:methyltransferase-domain-containing protein [Scleroderma yunnanense]